MKKTVLVTVEVTLEEDSPLLPQHVAQTVRMALDASPIGMLGISGIAVDGPATEQTGEI